MCYSNSPPWKVLLIIQTERSFSCHPYANHRLSILCRLSLPLQIRRHNLAFSHPYHRRCFTLRTWKAGLLSSSKKKKLKKNITDLPSPANKIIIPDSKLCKEIHKLYHRTHKLKLIQLKKGKSKVACLRTEGLLSFEDTRHHSINFSTLSWTEGKWWGRKKTWQLKMAWICSKAAKDLIFSDFVG